MAEPNFLGAIQSLPQFQASAEAMRKGHLRQLFHENPQRANEYSIATEVMYFDYSRQRVDKTILGLLLELAQIRGLKKSIDAMFQGAIINTTERRAVLHVALRKSGKTDCKEAQEAQRVLAKIQKFSEEVHSGKRVGVTGKPFRNILAIGIGGSYLGPECLAQACAPYARPGMRVRFLANIDGTDFVNCTKEWDPAETLVVIISKTFTTAETMQNARTVKEWLLQGLHSHPETIAKHCVAVSQNNAKAILEIQALGLLPESLFEIWDWVGGRFSVTSAVGALPLSLYLGYDQFQEILKGAEWMDQHFQNTPFAQNIPVLCGLIDIWNIHFLGCTSRALLPYAQGLARLPAYTQQGEMESNGKSVTQDREHPTPVTWPTGEIVFGEPGTNGQHSFYQLLHQGTHIIPADFIGFIEPEYPVRNSKDIVSHHEELLTNFLAQPDALAFGQDNPNLHSNFPGNRPSNVLLFRKLDPFTAGVIIAWTEHRIAVKGFIWGLNSFDQFGVELGKMLGKDIRGRMERYHKSQELNLTTLNPSTQKLLQAIMHKKLP